MKKQEIISRITIFTEEETDDRYKSLIEAAKKISEKAYAPYSGFQVGSAVLLENGDIITGNNQENAAYPSGICAERTAVFYANAQNPDVPVEAIAIAAQKNGVFTENPVSPCGSCRQVLLETENRFHRNIRVLLYGTKSVYLIESIRDLLPVSFGEDFLK